MRHAPALAGLPFAFTLLLAGCSLAGCAQKVGDPSVVPEIERWNAGLDDRDRELKFCKMAESPFGFYRGTAHLFWQWYGNDPRLDSFGGVMGFLQGDPHVLNFGTFDNDQDDVVYDLNDFDEGVIGELQIDVWRFAASIVLAARDLGGYSDGEVEDFVDAFVEAWLDGLDDVVDNDEEERITFDEDETIGVLSDFLDDREDEDSREQLLDRWTDGHRFRVERNDLDVATDSERRAITDGWYNYQATLGRLSGNADYFEILDISRRRDAGLGSLGTPRFYVLIEGPSTDDDDNRILDVKRQGIPSASEANPAYLLSAPFPDHAVRAQRAQKALALHVDDHLGVLRGVDGPYTVRDLSPYKAALPLVELHGKPTTFTETAKQWGRILAMAHARADNDYDDVLVVASAEAGVHARTDTLHDAFRVIARSVAFEAADRNAAGFLAFSAWVDETYGYDCR